MSQHAPQPAKSGEPLLNRAAWLRVVPFLLYLSFFLVDYLLTLLGVAPASLRWLYPVKTVLVAAALCICWREYTELKRWDLSPAAVLGAVAVGLLVFALWITLTSGWMTLGTSSGYDPRSAEGEVDWLLVVFRIAGAALVVPVMEELFWRSFLIRWLDKPNFELIDPARITLKSAVIGVVLFGFEHHLWLAGIVAGTAYTWLYMRQRSLWSPVIAHAVTNGVLGVWVLATGNWSFW